MGLTVRSAAPAEWPQVGELLVEAYSALEGFPTPAQAPAYYDNLRQVGQLTHKAGTALLVALSATGQILGCIVYFGDMTHYSEADWSAFDHAAGLRFLGVSEAARGLGAGKALMQAAIARAKAQGKREIILHTTAAMPVAWAMYERMDFLRAPELDIVGMMPIYGFWLGIEQE